MINQMLRQMMCLHFFKNQLKHNNNKGKKLLTVSESHYGTHDHHLSTFLFILHSHISKI